MKKLLLHFTILILTASCATIKHESFQAVNKLDENDYRQLNGKYSNHPKDGKGKLLRSLNNGEYQPESLWAQLNQFQTGSRSDWKDQTVDIEFLTAEKAVFKLYQGDSLIDKKMVRGTFKDGYFYKRPFFLAIPLIPVLFGYNTNRLRLGKAENVLVADYKWNIWMYFLVAGRSEKGRSSLIFSEQ